MVITFCGHSKCVFSKAEKEKLHNILIANIIKNPTCKFYLGGYGDFDNICFQLLKELKIKFPNIELIFITPYLNENYSKLEYAKRVYDDIIFPPIETVPHRFAILKRNEWMVSNANLLIAYVKHTFGGASTTMNYAIRKKLSFINIAENIKKP